MLTAASSPLQEVSADTGLRQCQSAWPTGAEWQDHVWSDTSPWNSGHTKIGRSGVSVHL